MIVTVVNHWSAVMSYYRGVEILLIHLLGLYVMRSARINTLQGGLPVYVYWGSQPYYYQIQVWENWAALQIDFIVIVRFFVQILGKLWYNDELMSQSKVNLLMLNPTSVVIKIPDTEPNLMSAEGLKLNFNCIEHKGDQVGCRLCLSSTMFCLQYLSNVCVKLGVILPHGLKWGLSSPFNLIASQKLYCIHSFRKY